MYRKGFTLIELSLSMVFVGILTLAVALIIRDTVASYRRGLTLNQVNTVGMDIVDDMRTAVLNSSSKSVLYDCEKYYYNNNSTEALERCIQDQGYNFTYWVKTGKVEVNGETLNDVPLYGAFCTGTYSYIWNSGYYETSGAKINGVVGNRNWAKLKYKSAGSEYTIEGSTTGDIDRPFRLLKVRDDQRGVCAGVIRNSGESGTEELSKDYRARYGVLPSEFDGFFNMTDYAAIATNEPPIDIIVTDKTYDLAIYDLFAARPAISSTQHNMFYSASFILGTVGGGINILAKGKSCAPPSDFAQENFNYCAINKFSFAVQSGVE